MRRFALLPFLVFTASCSDAPAPAPATAPEGSAAAAGQAGTSQAGASGKTSQGGAGAGGGASGPSCDHPAEKGPIAIGRARLAKSPTSKPVHLALGGEACADEALAAAKVVLPEADQSFVVLPRAGDTLVVGRGEVGAMYGAFEAAERVDLDGQKALDAPVVRSPRLRIRAANPFLVLPDVDEAKTDAWWFHEEGYWTEFLDMMVEARLDLLDLHGMYDLDSTVFPNLLPHFATAPSMPDVGAPPPVRAKNLASLKNVVRLAKERGIRVSLLTYGTGVPGLTGAAEAAYTKEAVADLLEALPDLDAFGFRVGESGHGVGWFADNVLPAMNAAPGKPRLDVRTWLSDKASISTLTALSPKRPIVEAKFNGEQYGPPWAITGGMMGKGFFVPWFTYSYEDYLTPPREWDFVFQLRAGGTHRLFRFASYEQARRTIETLGLGVSAGFTFEAAHAFAPQRDRHHADAADRFSPWTFRRDELAYLLFGRLGYDPNTDERVFRRHLAARTGTDELWQPLQAASEVVPWYQTAFTCGPDHRHFAPDLEWGGTTALWAAPPIGNDPSGICGTAYHGPFDTFAVASPWETAKDLAAGEVTSRLTPARISWLLDDAATKAAGAAGLVDHPDPETRDVARDCVALADLGRYASHKLRGAEALAIHAATGSGEYLSGAKAESAAAVAAWVELAAHTSHLAPVDDHLRMILLGYPSYKHADALGPLGQEAAAIDAFAAAVAGSPPMGAMPPPPYGKHFQKPNPAIAYVTSVSVTPHDASAAEWTVTAVTAGLSSSVPVRVLWKSFDGAADWQSTPMEVTIQGRQAKVPGNGVGVIVAVEVLGKGMAGRYPSPLVQTPYVVVAP